MKKFLLVFLIVFSLTGAVALAEVLEQEVESALPETYIEPVVQMMALTVEDELESRLFDGWTNLDEIIYVDGLNITVDECAKLYRKVLYENPMLYYVDTSFKYGYIDDEVVYFKPIYNETDISVINSTISQMDDATKEILFYVNGNMTDFEKVMAVHDYMVLNYEYDGTHTNHTATIMITKKGVCMSYALAFNHVMNILDIPCSYVSSDEMNHAWNIVNIDGEWYHIDLTYDDPGQDRFAQVRHTYTLLSTEAIQVAEIPHVGFDMGDVVAESVIFDDAQWRSSFGSVVYYDGVNYWNTGKEFVNDKGEVIYQNLAGANGKWDIGGGYVLTEAYGGGVCEHNGLIYFNSDTAIYRYNPKTGEVVKFADEANLCGIYVDENILRYSRFNIEDNIICEAGSIELGKTSIGEPYFEDSKIIVKVYKDTAEKLLAISFGSDHSQVATTDHTGFDTIELDAKDSQTVFFIKENLQPIMAKKKMNK